MKFIKDLLGLFQVFTVFMIPLAVCQRTFPEITFFDFIKPCNDFAVAMFSSFIGLTVNGIDLTLVYVSIPWVIYIMLAGMITNMLDGLTHKIDETVVSYKQTKIKENFVKQQSIETEQLEKKAFSYLAVKLVYSKFTISNLSENEIKANQDEIKKTILNNMTTTRGKLVDDEEFDDDNTFAILFFSQEDALNYIIRVKEQVKLLNNNTQEYGYSLAYKAIIDVQQPEAIRFYILEFLEKALNAVELNEVCTTSDFASRYKKFGKMKSVDFVSKGNYSINKEKVELKKLEY